ncbi:MAG: riboflavin synthase [Candidatus Omnitrophica bacterium]|nr:riboflavin synthase [Candidatus Omnitrophota bacterium]
MFTGIVEELGEVARISKRGSLTLLEIKAPRVSQDVATGDSISVNGACLTIIKNESGILSFEVMPETNQVTNLGGLRLRDKMNLERALKIGDRLSGHFVTGHIDCLGVIRRKHYLSENLSFEIVPAPGNMQYVLQKGSVAVDGISLTVAKKLPAAFCVYIIPHTLKNTTLRFKSPGDKVNLEFDILVKRASPL